MTDTEWLANIEAGHDVIVQADYGRVRLETVEHTTATQIVVSGSRYNRSNGWLRGASPYNNSQLKRPTPELVEKANRRLFLERLSATNYAACTTDQLRRIAAILDEPKESETKE